MSPAVSCRIFFMSEAIIETSHAGASAPQPPPPAGRFERHAAFVSSFLGPSRDVLVYLPPGYDADESRRYPVLYLHDGQNLFDPETSFIRGQDWRFHRTAETLFASGAVEPLIVVGVYNTGASRIDEYAPTQVSHSRVGGQADLYGRLLVEELKPFVDSRYRTRPGAADTGLGGSSLGGLVSLHLGLRYPEVFSRLAVVSPAAWWDERFIVRSVKSLAEKPPLRIWLDMGTHEGRQAVRAAVALRDALVSRGWVLDSDLKYFEARGGQHTEADWARRVDPILRYLFPG